MRSSRPISSSAGSEPAPRPQLDRPMIYLQVLANGLVLGGLYAGIAVGFSLVWGVLNVINIMHGSFVVLGSYIAYFAYAALGLHPFLSVALAGAALGLLAYPLQAGLINRVVGAPVLMTLTLTFAVGALMAGAAGSLLSLIYPISPLNSGLFLGKAFVICVLGGLGSVPGAMAGGLALGLVESFGAHSLRPEHVTSLSFGILILLLMVRPSGLLGRKGYE